MRGHRLVVRKLTAVVAKAEEVLLAVITIGMVLLALAQILMRNVLNQGLLWADPLLRHCVLWLAFLGALYGTKKGRHLSLDALSKSISPSVARVTHVISQAAAAAASFGLGVAASRLVSFEATAATTSSVGLPTWWLQLPMPVCLWLIGLRFVLRIFQPPET
jgi:TRAP-type C4-dicarboxylate transport system permease small subunit